MMIGEISKNSTEKIRVTISEYKGYTFLDVRVYYEDDQGEWKPTKKGITVSNENVEPLIKLLTEGKKKLKQSD
jgi:hypothetical protein